MTFGLCNPLVGGVSPLAVSDFPWLADALPAVLLRLFHLVFGLKTMLSLTVFQEFTWTFEPSLTKETPAAQREKALLLWL